MKKEEFNYLKKQGYNRIPLVRSRLADMDTPVSTYLKLADSPNSYLLESVQGGERWGRYSFIGLPAQRIIRVEGYEVFLRSEEKEERHRVDNPLDFIASLYKDVSVPDLPYLPRFCGGLVGYFSYETIGYVEPRLNQVFAKPNPLGCPHILLMESDELVVFDNLTGQLHLVCYARADKEDAWERARQKLDRLEKRLTLSATESRQLEIEKKDPTLQYESSFTREDYEAAVGKIKEYIRAGDVMQVVPSQRMSTAFRHKPLDFYRILRVINPAPYMFHLNLGDFYVIGASPEILARLEGKQVTLRPIAGTRPRGATGEEDERLERELLSDAKELAEHVMLIDLGRNDVGRIAEIGSVRLTDKFVVERYSHVMHLVSNVVGTIKDGLSAMDLLKATLPAGTLSGAPKIRAMEIIAELEPMQRGVYGGALGYLSWQGNMDLCIAIRTVVIKDSRLYIQAGGGIVADSDPAKEWQETINKRKAVFRALSMLHHSGGN